MNYLMHLPSAVMISQSRIQAMNQGFRTQQDSGYASIIMIAIVFLTLGLAAGIYFYVKFKAQKVVDDPALLFRELSRAHGLNGRQRKLLLQLAKSRGLKDPCTLFLSPSLFSLDPQSDAQLCQPKILKKFLVVQRILFTSKQVGTTA